MPIPPDTRARLRQLDELRSKSSRAVVPFEDRTELQPNRIELDDASTPVVDASPPGNTISQNSST